MNWQQLFEQAQPKHIWMEISDYVVHAHQWHRSDDFTLVFIHGAMANNTWWQHIASQFQTGNILSIDLSGHGLSEWCTPYTLEKHAKEVVSLIEAYGTGPIYIAGHSYGGAVAMLAKTFIPVEHVVMCDTPLYLVLEQNEQSTKSYIKNQYKTLEETIARFKPIPNQPIENFELFKLIAAQSIKKIETGYTWQFDPMFHRRIVTQGDQENIQNNSSGMSYWYGEYSPFATDQTLQKAKQFNMTLKMIPGAYHAVTVDAPDFILEQLKYMVENTK